MIDTLCDQPAQPAATAVTTTSLDQAAALLKQQQAAVRLTDPATVPICSLR
jgi:hypothetical protein